MTPYSTKVALLLIKWTSWQVSYHCIWYRSVGEFLYLIYCVILTLMGGDILMLLVFQNTRCYWNSISSNICCFDWLQARFNHSMDFKTAVDVINSDKFIKKSHYKLIIKCCFLAKKEINNDSIIYYLSIFIIKYNINIY